jgi:hypothetical protein
MVPGGPSPWLEWTVADPGFERRRTDLLPPLLTQGRIGGGGGEPPRWIAPVSELGIIAWAWCLTRIGSKVRLIWAFWITMSAQQSCCNRMRGDGRNQKSFLNKCIIQLISDVSHNQTMIIGKGSMVDSTNSDITIFLQIIASTVIYSQSPSN